MLGVRDYLEQKLNLKIFGTKLWNMNKEFKKKEPIVWKVND